MQQMTRSRRRLLTLPFLALFWLPGPAQPVQATEPVLTVRFVDGDSTVYAVRETRNLTFTEDSLNVAAYGRVDHYPTAEVARIVFRWLNPAGIKDPNDAAALVKAMHLFQNQPNPFAPETRIAFDLPRSGPVEVVIYGVNGRLVRRLVKDAREAGRYTARWDGRDDSGAKVGGGIYFYQLTAPGVEESRRMILLP